LIENRPQSLTDHTAKPLIVLGILGINFIEKLATGLKHEFAKIKVFSRWNLYTMSQ